MHRSSDFSSFHFKKSDLLFKQKKQELMVALKQLSKTEQSSTTTSKSQSSDSAFRNAAFASPSSSAPWAGVGQQQQQQPDKRSPNSRKINFHHSILDSGSSEDFSADATKARQLMADNNGANGTRTQPTDGAESSAPPPTTQNQRANASDKRVTFSSTNALALVKSFIDRWIPRHLQPLVTALSILAVLLLVMLRRRTAPSIRPAALIDSRRYMSSALSSPRLEPLSEGLWGHISSFLKSLVGLQ
jgi:hypothetical protein